MCVDILDIPGGKKPRPLNYERIYWDFVAAGQVSPRGDGDTIALTGLMKKAGYSDAEFAKLKEAQDNSNALVKTEVIAMNAVFMAAAALMLMSVVGIAGAFTLLYLRISSRRAEASLAERRAAKRPATGLLRMS